MKQCYGKKVMKRSIAVFAIALFSFGYVHSANYVDVGVSFGDTILVDQAGQFIVSVENDAKLGGISLGFHIYSPDGATFVLNSVASQFAPATPNGSTNFTGVPGSRWMSGAAVDGSCWDLGGTLVNDNLSPAQILIGGAALGGGLDAGGLEPMLELHFTAGGVQDPDVRTLCIDSMFYPPAGQFIFDPGGVPATNLPLCLPVIELPDLCPEWDAGLPTTMTISHCNAGQVTLSATDPEGYDVYYYLVGVTGGSGTAMVGEQSGVVTYTPDPADIGQAITIEVEATDPVNQQGGCVGSTWTLDVSVTNTAPVIDCGASYNMVAGGNTLFKSDISATDADACDVLSFSIVNVTPVPVGTYSIDAGTGAVTFAADDTDNGILYLFTVEVTDGYTTATCSFEVDVLPVEFWEVQIEKTHQTIQGHFVDVDVSMTRGSEIFGGFDFLIGYDPSALAFTEAHLGDDLVQCGWEYFTYRYSWNGNCGGACPSGILRMVGMAETNNGTSHPDYGCIANLIDSGDPFSIATMTFFVSNDLTLECMYVPIRFYWMDCGDNTMSTVNGDTLAINRHIYTVSGNEIQDYNYGFPGFVGAPDSPCLEGDKYSPIRFIDFINGGIDIVCGDSIDARGDLNANGVGYEIADAVMFTNYFISGLAAFGDHIDASISASDVNADGISLSVADLVYLVRVVVGDAQPYPKPQPGAYVTLAEQGGQVTVDASLDLGAILLTFDVRGEIGTPVLNVDMDMKYTRDGDELRVLIYDIGKRSIEAGAQSLVTVPGDVTLIDAEASSYDGATVESFVRAIPERYALLQNTPNPFNPATTIALALPVEADWTIEIFNITGQVVREFRGHGQTGTVEITWDGTDNSGKAVAS
ncbi:MAG: FlgD immunoglobulin-like domain containing protein, partial [Candidatus Thorarchaeota archaeon]